MIGFMDVECSVGVICLDLSAVTNPVATNEDVEMMDDIDVD